MRKFSFLGFFFGALVWLFGCTRHGEAVPPCPDPQPRSEQSVSAQQAAQVAGLFMSQETAASKSSAAPRTVRSVEALLDRQQQPTMYAINYNEGGFVLVSATRDYYPVLAYSDKNSFALDPENEGLAEWVDVTQQAIRAADQLPDSIKSRLEVLWRLYDPSESERHAPAGSKASAERLEAFYNRINWLRNQYYGFNFYALSNVSPEMFQDYSGYGIYDNLCSWADQYGSPREYTIVAIRTNHPLQYGPLLTTQWHQEDTFNNKCPNQYPAGCVAIAMAQIMKYHRHPARYDWSAMPDTYGTDATQTLIRDIGVAVDMQYALGGSGSNISNANAAFNNVFGYQSTWTNLTSASIEGEVLIGRPVYVRGGNATGSGHAWVCDGVSYARRLTEYFAEYQMNGVGSYYYSTPVGPSANSPAEIHLSIHTLDSFYMNWGWKNTQSNGWYRIDDTRHPWSTYFVNRQCLLVRPNR